MRPKLGFALGPASTTPPPHRIGSPTARSAPICRAGELTPRSPHRPGHRWTLASGPAQARPASSARRPTARTGFPTRAVHSA